MEVSQWMYITSRLMLCLMEEVSKFVDNMKKQTLRENQKKSFGRALTTRIRHG